LNMQHISNCTVVGDSLVALESSLQLYRIIDGQFIRAKADYIRKKALQLAVLHSRLTQPYSEEAALILRPNSKNYAHWLVESLPALYYLNQMKLSCPIIIPSTIARSGHSYVTESLACYENLTFRHLSQTAALNIRSALYLPAEWRKSQFDYVGPNAQFLADALKASGGAQSSRIYVSRSGRRKVSNQDELVEYLARFGFQVVDFSGMSLASQIEIGAGAELMLGAHGAGLANSLFMKKGSSVIEIDYPAPSRQDKYFFNVSRLTGKNHYFVRGRRANYAGKMDRNEDFAVDLRELETLFAGLGIKP
jgi:capsular polysaccharide biosynthesis protein